jgi:DNA-binding transcriptional MerR regulator
VTLKRGTNIKYRPRVFTEQDVAMLSSVLRSTRAIAVNIEIMRAFVRLREVLATNKELAKRFAALEARIEKRLADQDQVIVEILQAIRQLMNPPAGAAKRKIGFV